ncbi:MAG: asparagine synthase (glutamine-hydrolyzing) [Pseudomonadota bacterium]
MIGNKKINVHFNILGIPAIHLVYQSVAFHTIKGFWEKYSDMCGITGFLNIKGDMDRREIQAVATRMHEAIAHRGPDDADVWQDPDVSIVLAHRRLSIIDLSAEGRQPMVSGSGRYVCVYNGEIYNYLDIRADLDALGHSFRGRSDTEVMLSAFDQWGVNQSLQKLNGMFAIVLWDRQERQIHFIRDRFGKKPLYIGWAGQNLVFSSELKSFHQHPDFEPEIDRNALANYMQYACVHAPFSIFKNVWQLLPAGRLTLSVGAMNAGSDLSQAMETYWFMPDVVNEARANPIQKSENEVIDEFEGLLKNATAQRMISDVPLGAFLSGGIDSSVVVALMQQSASAAVKTFSIGFEEQAYNEAEHAKKIAEYLGTDHQEFYVTPKEAQDVIPTLPDMYDEPFADSSQIPTHLVSKYARAQATVVLTGDGGDEILGGYERHFMVPAAWKKVSWMPHFMRMFGAAVLKTLPENVYNVMRPGYPQFGRRIHKLAGMVAMNDPNMIYSYLMSSWHYPEHVVKESKNPIVPLLDSVWQPQGLNFSESMMYGDSLSYRPNDLMVKMDRASMAVSLEARAPLMDYKLFEYVWRLPHDLKVRGLSGKWLLKQVLKRHVPEELYERPKMGFGVPINEWLRGPLKDWAGDLLNPAIVKDQGFLNADLVDKAWQDHNKGITTNSTGSHLWTALMFQAWYERWMKK